MKMAEELQRELRSINRKSYPAYKDTKGSYRFPGYVLSIDHVQGDPFAAPSKLIRSTVRAADFCAAQQGKISGKILLG